jgi:ferritin-like metal-binding protein YciE
MGLFSGNVRTMDELFIHTLEDIYYAEHQIEKALPDMMDKASDAELKRGFKTHLGETRNQIKRLDQVFKKLGEEPKGTDCPAIDGIIEESNEIAGEVEDQRVLNAALIAAAQAVEHYEMTRYGTLVAWAKELGHRDVAAILLRNLKEEQATDKKLTALAKKKANPRATGKKAASGRSATGKKAASGRRRSTPRTRKSTARSAGRGRRKAA